jgi:hypothetical protein
VSCQFVIDCLLFIPKSKIKRHLIFDVASVLSSAESLELFGHWL